MRLAFRLAAFLLIAALSAMASCGGQGLTAPTSEAITSQWPGHTWDGGAKSGAFIAVAVDSTERNVVDLTQRLRLETTTDAGGTLVTVFGSDVDGGSAYLHLKYDGSAVHPTETQRGATLDESVLFLGITTQPNIVDIGLATIGGVPMPSGELQLAQVHFAPGAFTGVRSVSDVSTQAPTDLQFNGNALEWTYNSGGDFDQNSETNIADLTPLGVHLTHSTSDGQHDPADMVVDGDHNGVITIAELTVIGANFLHRTTDYQIQTGPVATGPWTMSGGGAVSQGAGVLPSGGGFLEYTFTVPAPTAGVYYSLQVFDGTTGGPRSNVVQFGVTLAPPQNLSASDDGTKITLTWDPPASGTPDSYDAYVSSDAGMAGAIKMNAAAISATTFDCNPIAVAVGSPHFFAVKAVYSAVSSDYSNIFNYGGAASPPTGLAAVKEGTQVRLTWTAPGSPDSYNAYVSANSDMSGAAVMNLPGAITTPTFLCPVLVDAAVEHYFTVRAVTASVETGDSNIAHYTPTGGADTTPPQWQGGTGIRAAEPDDTQVKIYWYPAVDPAPGTNPVQYYIYYVPDGTPIDWNSPNDVVTPSPPTNTTYTVPTLTNGQKYEFAVRAADSAVPPNVTSNTNSIFSTPYPYPDDGDIGTITSSDIASVRMPGEEIPRVFAVNHSNELWYAHFDGTNWITIDLNAAVIHGASRKYHPQAVAVGNDIHLLFATPGQMFEFYGDKDADPATWTLLPVSVSGQYTAVYGTGFCYTTNGNYLAACWAADGVSGEQLFYSDRDVAAATWSVPVPIMDGQPSIWQCDMAISDVTGAQWIVAPNGAQVSQSDCPEVWYATRASRGDLWTSQKASPTIKSSTEIAVEIDPTLNQPVMVNPTTVFHPVPLAGNLPATDAGVYTWTGTAWTEDPNSPLDLGEANDDQGLFVFTTVDTGRDPQLVFNAEGKAVAVWEWVQVESDYSDPNGDGTIPTTVTGSWRIADRPTNSWSSPSTSVRDGIFSSNSVTAGESYQHCLTCYFGPQFTGDLETEVAPVFAVRNDFPEGSLYYFRQAWP